MASSSASSAAAGETSGAPPPPSTSRARITVFEDWTPNTNHTGLYVALAKGWFKDAGLDVELVSADADNYAVTPAKKVMSSPSPSPSSPSSPSPSSHAIRLAVCPSESVISAATLPNRQQGLVAIAALAHRDTSAIVTLSKSGITRPSMLDGKVYASYNARFEDRIVSAMIKKDGGKGVFVSTAPEKLGIWNTILEGKSDATWVFLPWEGVEARRKGVGLNAFTLDQYGIPYGYTPVLAASPSDVKEHPQVLRAFLEAASRGYKYAASHAEESADMRSTITSGCCRARAATTTARRTLCPAG
jgi:ABC-type nitrate/sulfonate/bicarbonate transport system substrate-binding protein